MLKAVAQWIFMDKRGRAAAKKLRESQKKTASPKKKASGAPADSAVKSPPAEASGEREALLKETMALYRQRREEYEQLDEDTRERLVKLAAGKRPEEDC